MLGHSSGTITGRYVHHLDAVLLRAADRVANVIQGYMLGKSASADVIKMRSVGGAHMRRPVRVRRPPRSNEWLEGLPDRERHAAETLIQQVGVAGLDRVAAAYIEHGEREGQISSRLEMASLMIENGWTKNRSAEAVARRVLDRGESAPDNRR